MHQTEHRFIPGDARDLTNVDDESVELVVTSPPYPMIEMWDGAFKSMAPEIGECLKTGSGWDAFERMHTELDTVWAEVKRVLVDGGIACINIGDATRKLGSGRFRSYPNQSRIVETFVDLGFDTLPEILWRKPTNAPNKFMGSGMRPPNAYATLEHEYILIFRKGSRRQFDTDGVSRRDASAFFQEERNRWFSDLWADIRGEDQTDTPDTVRDRTAAFPFEIPHRLINMYSVMGDTVLDPFVGTGTTMITAAVNARNSIGVDIEDGFREQIGDRMAKAREKSNEIVRQRLDSHRQYVQEKVSGGGSFTHEAENYDFPVTSSDEKGIQLYAVDEVIPKNDGWNCSHRKVTNGDPAIHGGASPTTLDDF